MQLFDAAQQPWLCAIPVHACSEPVWFVASVGERLPASFTATVEDISLGKLVTFHRVVRKKLRTSPTGQCPAVPPTVKARTVMLQARISVSV